MRGWLFAASIAIVAACVAVIARRSVQAGVRQFLAAREPQPRDVFVEAHFDVGERQVAATLLDLLERHLPIDLERMRPDDRLVDDLRMDALDSMATVEYVLDIEATFSIDIPDEEAARLYTFRDIVSCVARRSGPARARGHEGGIA